MMTDDARANILVVDDTDTNIDILMEILGERYEVLVALDGASALEVAETEVPDLVLLDVMMPDMDGWEVCQRLKANSKTQGIPVIFITAKTQMEDEIRGFELGAVDFITKPISPPVVLRRVASTLALKEQTDRLTMLSAKLGKYLSPQVYESIFSGKQDVQIGGGRKKLTIFLSDIVDFTATTERLEPEDMTVLLNSYLDRMSSIAMAHGGTIDKFIGDAILIFFGDPVSKGVAEDARACLNMALEMRGALEELQREWFQHGVETPFQVRMGINTGFCTVGNFGSRKRMDYTIIGGQVNVAARLEQNALPDQILISHETWSLVKDDIHCIPKPPITVKGIPHPIQTYQVVGSADAVEDSAHAVRGYVQPATTLPPDAPVRDALDLLADAPPYGTVVLAGDSGPVGVLSRAGLDAALCAEQDKALLLDRPVSTLAPSAPVILDAGAPLTQAAQRMTDRTGASLCEAAIILQDGELLGILPIPVLLTQLTALAKEREELS
jgi:class 3 adenylate cyclase/CBS domain-containing protein